MSAETKTGLYTLIHCSDSNHVLTLLAQHSALVTQHLL
jgi:hypothetical protein